MLFCTLQPDTIPQISYFCIKTVVKFGSLRKMQDLFITQTKNNFFHPTSLKVRFSTSRLSVGFSKLHHIVALKPSTCFPLYSIWSWGCDETDKETSFRHWKQIHRNHTPSNCPGGAGCCYFTVPNQKSTRNSPKGLYKITKQGHQNARLPRTTKWGHWPHF